MSEDRGLFARLGFSVANGIGIGGAMAVGGSYFMSGLNGFLGFTIAAPDATGKFLFGLGLLMGVLMEYRDWFKRRNAKSGTQQ